MKLIALNHFLLLSTLSFIKIDCQKALSKSVGPPNFFLQDPHDGLCLAGSTYKRCGINTLWYVSGKPGNYFIHHKIIDDDDTNQCFAKSSCHIDSPDVILASCSHCGAKKWNILGDSETGYVLTESSNKNCIKRDGVRATLIKCDKGYSGFNLQFASKDDIAAMNSEGARFIEAAAVGDLKEVKSFVSNKVDVNSRDWDNLTATSAAAGKGHLAVVKYLVSAGSDVNLFDKDNITALMEASLGGFEDIVRYLHDSKADINLVSATGVTALWLAASEGHVKVVDYLLSKSASANTRRNDGISALMAASSGGFTPVVKSLISQGADVNNKDKDGLTALISASENGTIPLVRLLVDSGAEVDVVSDSGFSPLIVAAAHGHTEVCKILIDAGATINLDHPESVSPLMYAAAGGFPDVVELLIQKGANVNLRHKQGGSALMEAATSGNETVVKILLNAGADPFIVDDDGVNSLMSAASQGHTNVAKLLIGAKLDINAVAKSGGTAVMFSAGAGHNDTTKLLIDSGCDVNIPVKATPEYIEQVIKALEAGKEDVEQHKNGVTALSIAAQGGHIGTVKLLVEARANITAVDDDGFTALLNAVKFNFFEVASYLLENGANPNDYYVDDKGVHHNILMDAISLNQTRFAKNLIERNANLSYTDSDGVTLLTQAAYLGLTDIVDALIVKGADFSAANKEGINPLIASASEGHVSIVQKLLERKGIDPDAKDKDGTNSLMAASVRGHKEVVELLLRHNAQVNAQNVDGHTALMFAYNGKNQVETLLDKYSEYIKDDSDNSSKVILEALKSHIEVVNILLQHNADPNIKDLEGHIALDFDYKSPNVLVEGTITPEGKTEL